MIAGHVSAIRELKRGLEAQVCVGVGAKGYANITITASSPKVHEALEALRKALREEAHELLGAAWEWEIKQGRRPIGARMDA